MKPTFAIFAGILVIAAASCTATPKQVSGQEVMANLRSDPLDCMVYRGSDATFYYFDRTQFKTTKRFKVKRDEVELPPNATVGRIPSGMKLRNTATQPAAANIASVTPASRPAATQPATMPAAPTAAQAKQAVVDFIRAHSKTFEGHPDADELARLPLVDKGEGWFAFGAVEVNPTARRYHATIGGDRGMVDYAGSISEHDDKWIASVPAVIYFHGKP